MPSVLQVEVFAENETPNGPLIGISQRDDNADENQVIYLEPYQLDLFIEMLKQAKKETESYGCF